ncbi:uncharacterized protein IWZ02DRAFT_459778 [Phyllosticta citriasiana]|uniref:uncharacterized protein n=1 Tax=Phyllosticta citriasiana TaxID=595635 RepID=UPI0030FDC947
MHLVECRAVRYRCRCLSQCLLETESWGAFMPGKCGQREKKSAAAMCHVSPANGNQPNSPAGVGGRDVTSQTNPFSLKICLWSTRVSPPSVYLPKPVLLFCFPNSSTRLSVLQQQKRIRDCVWAFLASLCGQGLLGFALRDYLVRRLRCRETLSSAGLS